MKCTFLTMQTENIITHSKTGMKLKEYDQSFKNCHKEDCSAWGYYGPRNTPSSFDTKKIYGCLKVRCNK